VVAAAAQTPKQRKAARKAAKAGPVRPARSAEERAAERAEVRARKAAERRRARARARAKHAAAPRAEPVPALPRAAGQRKLRQGIVVSDKANKTIVVRIDVARRHRRYQKVVRSSMTLHAHDERNEAGTGDKVTVVESRPLSRTKHWRLVEVLEKAR
jgi:small subunit ribosomal protein S17